MSARPVLFLHSSSGRYGADRQLELIATGLDRARFEPIVVLPDDGELADALRSQDVEVTVRPLGVLRREHASATGLGRVALDAARDGGSLARLIRARRIALVHSNTSVVLGGAAAAALARVPHVWHVREDYSRFGRAWPLYRRVLLSGAAAVLCVSRSTAQQFGGARKVSVIYDGLAPAAERSERVGARTALGLPPEQPVIAVVGRISDWKGQDVLIRALAETPLAEIGAVGLIAGDAWAGAEDRMSGVRTVAAECGVEERVKFAGFVEDVSTVYGAADLVAVPSTAPDPLPGSAIEAAAAGCTVLASAHGGLPEIIRDGDTGRLVAPGDPSALASVARALLEDPAARARLGEAAARDVRERFAPERLLAEVTACYERLL